jgi:hypothetical protein
MPFYRVLETRGERLLRGGSRVDVRVLKLLWKTLPGSQGSGSGSQHSIRGSAAVSGI